LQGSEKCTEWSGWFAC